VKDLKALQKQFASIVAGIADAKVSLKDFFTLSGLGCEPDMAR